MAHQPSRPVGVCHGQGVDMSPLPFCLTRAKHVLAPCSGDEFIEDWSCALTQLQPISRPLHARVGCKLLHITISDLYDEGRKAAVIQAVKCRGASRYNFRKGISVLDRLVPVERLNTHQLLWERCFQSALGCCLMLNKPSVGLCNFIQQLNTSWRWCSCHHSFICKT